MTMTLEWLSAILAPREIAPHPNFFSEEHLTEAGALAALAAFDTQTWRRILGDTRLSDSISQERMQELQAIQAMSPFDGQSHTDEVEAVCSDLPVDQAVPVGLLTVVAMAAAERHTEALDFLALLAQRVKDAPASPEKEVLLGIVMLQEAFRRFERGASEDYQALDPLLDDVQSHLFAVDQQPWQSFPTSAGVQWGSDVTIDHVVVEVRASYQALRETLAPFMSEGWKDIVRQPAPYLTLANFRRAISGYESLVQQQWQAGPYSQTRTVFADDPILTPLRASLLHAELSGDPGESRHFRREEALVLLLSPFEHLAPDRDGPITLLRRSRDEQLLNAALAKVRAEGPLEPLTTDARKLARLRNSPALLTREDLLVLRSAAQLLDEGEALKASADAAALAELTARGEYVAATRWVSPSIIEVSAWTAALTLAQRAGAPSEVMLRLLDRNRAATKPDALFAQRLAPALAGLDWDQLENAVRVMWMEWIESQLLEHDTVDDLASNILDLSSWVLANLPARARSQLLRDRSGLRFAGLVIDSLRMAPEYSITPETSNRAAAIVENEINALTDDAQSGKYSWGAYSPLGMAATGIVEAGWSRLWPALLRALGSTHVLMQQKDPALFYFASRSHDLPYRRAASLRDLCFALVDLEPPDLAFERPAPPPHPSCIALLWSLRSRTRDKPPIDEQVFRATAHKDPRARRVAARMLGESGAKDAPPWMALLLVQLAADSDAAVRADAALSLGRVLGRFQQWQETLLRAFVPLLTDASLLVPLAALRGLNENSRYAQVASKAISQAIRFAEEHPAAVVRREARHVRASLAEATKEEHRLIK